MCAVGQFPFVSETLHVIQPDPPFTLTKVRIVLGFTARVSQVTTSHYSVSSLPPKRINTLRLISNDYTFKRISVNENILFETNVSLKYVTGGPIVNKSAKFQVMAGRHQPH